MFQSKHQTDFAVLHGKQISELSSMHRNVNSRMNITTIESDAKITAQTKSNLYKQETIILNRNWLK